MNRDVEKEADEFFATVPCKTAKVSNSALIDGLCAKQVIKWLGDTYSMVRSSTTALNIDDRERATHLKSLLDAIEAIRKLHL